MDKNNNRPRLVPTWSEREERAMNRALKEATAQRERRERIILWAARVVITLATLGTLLFLVLLTSGCVPTTNRNNQDGLRKMYGGF